MTTVTINAKGDVVDDQTAQVYSFLDLPAVNPKAVSDQLANANGDDVEVDISSNGGDPFAASEIYTMLRNYKGPVDVKIQGMAASAASVIAMAGDTVEMAPTAILMIHRAWSYNQGNTDDMAHEAQVLNEIDQSIAAAYENKTGLSENKVLGLMTQETFMNAKTAVANGFADSIMFEDAKQPQYADSLTHLPNKQAVSKFLTLVHKVKDTAPEPQTVPEIAEQAVKQAAKEKTSASQPANDQDADKHAEMIASKLAILMPESKEEK